jgi:hypothetical protein
VVYRAIMPILLDLIRLILLSFQAAGINYAMVRLRPKNASNGSRSILKVRLLYICNNKSIIVYLHDA